MVIYGSKGRKIGQFDIDGTTCPYCEQVDSQHISVYGKYAHIYWIPLFPVGKKVIAECDHCKRTYEKSDFSTDLKFAYSENKNKVKRPIRHWTGLIIAGLFVLAVVIGGIFADPPDPRDEMLKADLDRMMTGPTMEFDSISYKIKTIFDAFVVEEIKPEEFEYLTEIKGDKSLTLVKIPKLKKIDKKVRGEVIEMIELVLDKQGDLKDKNKYIGVHGKYNMMMVKTPTANESSNLVSPAPLYEFYGPKLEKED